MAEVTMDISEYNEILETKNLLKESLNRERELGEQINLLNKEKEQALNDKIKAYEEAKHNVIIVNKKVNEDIALKAMSQYETDIELERMLHWYYNSPNKGERQLEVMMSKLKDTIFETHTKTTETTESIVSKDYDEAIKEIEKNIELKYKSEIDSIKTHKSQIKRLEADLSFQKDEVIRLIGIIELRNSEIERFNEEHNKLNEEYNKLKEEYSILSEKFEASQVRAKELADVKFNVFNAFSVLSNLVRQIKEK